MFTKRALNLMRFFETWVRTLVLSAKVSRFHRKSVILVASDTLPLPDQEAGGMRMVSIMQGISKGSCDIVFLSFREKDQLPGNLAVGSTRKKYERLLRDTGTRHILYGKAEAQHFLRIAAPRVNTILVAFPHVAAWLIPHARLVASKAHIAYDMVDFHALRLERESKVARSAEKAEESKRMAELERRIFAASDTIMAISDAERAAVLSFCPQYDVHVVENAFTVPDLRPKGSGDRRNVLFLGGFWHTPNLDAVEWFASEVWPEVRKKNPDVEFHIAGSNMDDRVYKLEAVEGVRVIGFVANLKAFFDAGRVFVAPLRFGAGMKGKVGLSMAYGLPVITTKIGAEGMDISHDKDFLLAENASDFVKSIDILLKDDATWGRLQHNALSFVARRLSIDGLESKLRAALPSVYK